MAALRSRLSLHRILICLASICLFVLVLSYHASPKVGYIPPHVIPRRIVQTWAQPYNKLKAPFDEFASSWKKRNPTYQYQLYTDEDTIAYVSNNFKSEPSIVDTFKKISDNILRADFFRYLALLAEGGVYSDIDTLCTRPIDHWIPDQFKSDARLVIGIEYDSLGETVKEDAAYQYPVQFAQWTIMSVPHHPAMRSIVDTVTTNLKSLGGHLDLIKADTKKQVLNTTGPLMFAPAILGGLAKQANRPVDYAELSSLLAPKLYGDILILPISAFASGSPHSNAPAIPNSQQLVHHMFNGWQSWHRVHDD